MSYWSHDEQKSISSFTARFSTIVCDRCGAILNKYVESHYTGGEPCVLLTKYCRYCNNHVRKD
jgi:hypothetical protein